VRSLFSTTNKIFAFPNKCGTGNQFLIILETLMIREIVYLAQSMCIVYNKRYAYFVQRHKHFVQEIIIFGRFLEDEFFLAKFCDLGAS
jgi:hypothetical protein